MVTSKFELTGYLLFYSHEVKLIVSRWDDSGEYVALRSLNKLRVPLVTRAVASAPPHSSQLPLSGCKILDVGCGGGLLSEVKCYHNSPKSGLLMRAVWIGDKMTFYLWFILCSNDRRNARFVLPWDVCHDFCHNVSLYQPLARLGASVTGLDAAPENIVAANARKNSVHDNSLNRWVQVSVITNPSLFPLPYLPASLPPCSSLSPLCSLSLSLSLSLSPSSLHISLSPPLSGSPSPWVCWKVWHSISVADVVFIRWCGGIACVAASAGRETGLQSEWTSAQDSGVLYKQIVQHISHNAIVLKNRHL